MRRLEFRGEELTPEKLRALGEHPEVEHLVIRGGSLTNEGLAPLASLTGLQSLTLCEMKIDDGFFTHLRGLKKLEALNLAYTNVRGDFTTLAELPLRDLRMEGCRFVGDASAGTLALIPTLRHLEIHMTGLTDAGVACLAGLPLEVLWLGPRVTDEAMRTLAGIPTLKYLDICAHMVSDAGVAMLVTLPKLEVLWLSRCGLTDAAVGSLIQLRGLRELNVNFTGVTESGLARLRTALPACRFPEPD